jgi:gamma-glutamyltranspeptidase/glutathione hydrolase
MSKRIASTLVLLIVTGAVVAVIQVVAVQPAAYGATNRVGQPVPNGSVMAFEPVVSTDGKVVAEGGGVSAEHPLAVRAGLEMLQRGGNAVDAMVATALALCVVRNGANGLGGYGGAMVIYRRDLSAPVVVDFNTRAPLAATEDMFLGKPTDIQSGVRSITTWNTVAGLAVALERFGTMEWADVIQPAIRLADEGFVVSPGYARALASAHEKLQHWSGSRAIFTRDGRPLQAGEQLVQRDLAASLRLLAKAGPDTLYSGRLARTIVDYIRSEGGILSMEDLADWRERHVRILQPAQTRYRGYDVYTSPENTGGQYLIATLNLLRGFDLPTIGFSAQSVHPMLESYKLGFADRLWFIGDPSRARVPYQGLMSDAYADERRRLIDPDVAWPYARPGDPWAFVANGSSPSRKPSRGGAPVADHSGGPAIIAKNIPAVAPEGDTASTATMDRNGNMVALTMTLRSMLGSGVTAPGTGITLNDGMGLFYPTQSDIKAIPNHPNRIEPGKLALNNMSAFVVLRNGVPYVAGGGSGGRRIMTECLQLIVSLLDWKMDVQAAVDAPRFHVEQKEPALVEEAFPYGPAKELERKGHRLEAARQWGAVHVIVRDEGTGKQHVARESRQDVSAAGGLVGKKVP